MLSFEETKNRLKLLPFDYRGQGKNKTLKLQDPELFKAIYYWSQPLESKMKECGRYASSYNFSHRVMFILNKDGNVENMKCACGRRYGWTPYCRHCSEPKDMTRKLSQGQQKIWKERNRTSSRIKIANELFREGKSPAYDVESIPVLNKFALDYGLNLQHAEYLGEKFVPELGYWLDGFDPSRNVVVEIDEPYHFYKHCLGQRDIRRHRELIETLQCSIYRLYFNKRTNRVVLYNTPENPENWDYEQGYDLADFDRINSNGTKRYKEYRPQA